MRCSWLLRWLGWGSLEKILKGLYKAYFASGNLENTLLAWVSYVVAVDFLQ